MYKKESKDPNVGEEKLYRNPRFSIVKMLVDTSLNCCFCDLFYILWYNPLLTL